MTGRPRRAHDSRPGGPRAAGTAPRDDVTNRLLTTVADAQDSLAAGQDPARVLAEFTAAVVLVARDLTAAQPRPLNEDGPGAATHRRPRP